MSQQSTFDAVREILVEGLGIEEEQVTQEAHLQEDLELDSTDTVEIALQLKKRLGVDVKLQLRDDPTVAQLCEQVDLASTEQTPSPVPEPPSPTSRGVS